jgi:hypothetical protein
MKQGQFTRKLLRALRSHAALKDAVKESTDSRARPESTFRIHIRLGRSWEKVGLDVGVL